MNLYGLHFFFQIISDSMKTVRGLVTYPVISDALSVFWHNDPEIQWEATNQQNKSSEKHKLQHRDLGETCGARETPWHTLWLEHCIYKECNI